LTSLSAPSPACFRSGAHRRRRTWRTFLTNHARDLVSIDFFTVPTARWRVLFVFVVLAHDRRRVLHFNVTEHPTAAWTAQQIVDAFPDDSAPSYLLRDRDSVYGHVFRQRVKGMGVGEVVTTPQSPWQNPFAERLIGSIRRECLDHVVVLGQRHLRRILTAYFAYYHRTRTHLSLEKDAPDGRPIEPPSLGAVCSIPEVGGLHHPLHPPGSVISGPASPLATGSGRLLPSSFRSCGVPPSILSPPGNAGAGAPRTPGLLPVSSVSSPPQQARTSIKRAGHGFGEKQEVVRLASLGSCRYRQRRADTCRQCLVRGYIAAGLVHRSEVGQHRRQEFGDGRMNVHRAADHRPRRLCVHHVENRVDDLVAARAEDRGA
jgi:putative transposase